MLTEAAIEALGDHGSLDEILALLATSLPDDLGPARLEAVATFQLLNPTLAEATLLKLEEAVVGAHAPSSQRNEVVGALRGARAARLTVDTAAAWPNELWPAAIAARSPTQIAELAELAVDQPAIREPLLAALLLRPAPRKSKARTRIDVALKAMGDQVVLAAWKQQHRWRGLLPQDPALPLQQRLENWVWAADEVFEVPSEFTPRQRGMYVTMLKELCGVRTPDDWRVAVDYFTDENFHGLAAILEPRATPEP